jgi:ParB-like chromosome segregation protein Spo0J
MKTKPKISDKNPADLIPYARNAKKHDDAQIAAIAGSIKEFGFNNPVLIDGGGGIIAGHGRVQAALKLGMTEVPCIVLDHLTDTQRRAYILADNKLAEIGGGWDEDLLSLELAELAGEIDLTLAGFEDVDIGAFDVEEAAPPELKDGDRAPFRQATFTIHDEQWEEIEAAIAKAKREGHGESAVNENSNGNALAWICQCFNRGGDHGQG